MQTFMPIDWSIIDWRMILICVVFIVLDIISGVIKGASENNFSSSVMRVGLIHKATTLLVLVGAGVCDIAVNFSQVTLPLNVGIVDVFGVCVIVMELSSFLENCVAINPSLGNLGLFKIFGLTKSESDVNSIEDMGSKE